MLVIVDMLAHLAGQAVQVVVKDVLVIVGLNVDPVALVVVNMVVVANVVTAAKEVVVEDVDGKVKIQVPVGKRIVK